MKSVAAINREHSKPLEIGEIDVDDPQPNEVMVKVVASGICHTDFLVRDGIYPTALPAVAGHEGAGIVEKIGSNVTTVVPGDYVIMAPFMWCLQDLPKGQALVLCEFRDTQHQRHAAGRFGRIQRERQPRLVSFLRSVQLLPVHAGQ